MKKYILAITGASGSIIGIRLLDELARDSEVHLVISNAALQVIFSETGIDWLRNARTDIERKLNTDKVFFYNDSELGAPIASGSFKTDGMFIVPCSMKTLSAVASGYANNLIERAADVMIKEGRPLLLSPREMPLSAIHLENMLKLARIGVRIVPPVPAFYHKPQTVEEMVDFIVGKILDSFNIENNIFKRWGGDS